MAELRIGARALAPHVVVHLDPEKESDAKLKAINNHLDDVFITVGKIFPKHYVASGDGIAKGVSIGQEVELDGKKGVVTDLDDQGWEKTASAVSASGIGFAAGTAIASLAKAKFGLALVIGGALAAVGYLANDKFRGFMLGQNAELMKQYEKK